ncbi:MAG TPA: hypothetical protein EYP07_05645 [Kiloniellaceae bacterium]|nr:hypothetical protein [Kiloniellaceae bacterium]
MTAPSPRCWPPPAGSDNEALRAAQTEARNEASAALDGLIAKQRELTVELGREKREREEAAVAAALANQRAREEAEAERERAEAAKAQARAEKEAARERSKALSEIARLEEQAAIAGLEGIERLEVERDRALAEFEERLRKQLLTEEEFARARLAIEDRFQKEKEDLEEEARKKREEARQREEEKAERAAKRAADKARREAEREAERAAEARARPFINAAERIQQGFSDSFTTIFRDFEFKSEDALDFFKDAFARMLAEIATLAIARPVIVPAVAAVAGAFGLDNAAIGQVTGNLGGGGGGGGFGGAGGVNQIFGVSDIFPEFFGGGEFGSALNAFGASLGFAQTFPAGTASALGVAPVAGGLTNAPATAPGFFGSATFGSFLGGVGAGFGVGSLLNGLFGGNATGGAIGSGVGSVAGAAIGSVVPGIGTVLGGILGGGAGGLLGGLFGEDKDFPFARTELSLGNDGFAITTRDVLDGGPIDDVVRATEIIGQTVESFAAAIGATIESSAGISFGTGSGRGLGSGFFVGDRSISLGSTGGLIRKNIGSSEEAADLAVRELIKATEFGGIDPEVEAVLRTSLSLRSDLEETAKDVELARAIFDGAFGFETERVVEAERAIEEINTAFDEMTQRAQELGLSVQDLEQGRANALEELTAGFDEGIRLQILSITDPLSAALEQLEEDQARRLEEAEALGADLVEVERLAGLERQRVIEQATAGALSSLKAFQDEITFGGLSGATASQSVAGARAAFEAAAAQASAGSATALGQITTLGRDLIDLSRTAFASSAEFQGDLARVREIVENLLGDVPGFGSGTLSAPAGFAVLGEFGPELVRFRGGEQVLPAADTARFLSPARAGGSADLVRELARGNAEIVDELRFLRGEVRALREDRDRLELLLARRQSA